MVIFAMWTVVGLLIAGYIWFVVWRIRVERRKKEAKDGGRAELSGVIGDGSAAPKLAARLKEQGVFPPIPSTEPAPDPLPAPAPAPTATPAPASTSAPSAWDGALAPPVTTASASTVAELLTGIRLPADLVPITMMAPRPDVGERVAFASDPGASANDVGRAFADELKRLGYTVKAVGSDQLAATRGDDALLCQLHLDARYAEIGGKRAFPAVEDGATVIEVWVPF